jgi:hypothetical protein
MADRDFVAPLAQGASLRDMDRAATFFSLQVAL